MVHKVDWLWTARQCRAGIEVSAVTTGIGRLDRPSTARLLNAPLSGHVSRWQVSRIHTGHDPLQACQFSSRQLAECLAVQVVIRRVEVQQPFCCLTGALRHVHDVYELGVQVRGHGIKRGLHEVGALRTGTLAARSSAGSVLEPVTPGLELAHHDLASLTYTLSAEPDRLMSR